MAPTAPPEQVIDHLIYLDIMDIIFQEAPYSSLRVLRMTCRAYLARVDLMLTRHILLETDNGNIGHTAMEKGRRLPGALWLREKQEIQAKPNPTQPEPGLKATPGENVRKGLGFWGAAMPADPAYMKDFDLKYLPVGQLSDLQLAPFSVAMNAQAGTAFMDVVCSRGIAHLAYLLSNLDNAVVRVSHPRDMTRDGLRNLHSSIPSCPFPDQVVPLDKVGSVALEAESSVTPAEDTLQKRNVTLIHIPAIVAGPEEMRVTEIAVPYIVPFATRLVLSLHLPSLFTAYPLINPVLTDSSLYLREVVIILPDPPADMQPGLSPRAGVQGHTCRWLLAVMGCHEDRGLRNVKITLVNAFAHSIPKSGYPDEHLVAFLADIMRKFLHKGIEHPLAQVCYIITLITTPGKFNFYTKQEYIQRVGRIQFEFETTHPHDGGWNAYSPGEYGVPEGGAKPVEKTCATWVHAVAVLLLQIAQQEYTVV